MQTTDLVARCATEWLEASGARTPDRLAELVDHYAGTYGPEADARAVALEAAGELARRRRLL